MLTPEFKAALDARLFSLATVTLATQPANGHQVKIEHLRQDIPAPAWFSWEVMNSYIDLLRSAFCPESSADEHAELPLAMMPLQFFKGLCDAASGPSETALDPAEYSQGINNTNFFEHRAILIPVYHGAHFSLVYVMPHSNVIRHFDADAPPLSESSKLSTKEKLSSPERTALEVVGGWVKSLVTQEAWDLFNLVIERGAPRQAGGSGDCGPLLLLEMRFLACGAAQNVYGLAELSDNEMGQLCINFRYRIMAELICQKLNPKIRDLPPVTFA
ncbi:hypothetical protein LTR15_008195 [Elasticomyces elasticus]|nr:hypothetical protein LTR15_008195 [Elasticomyces elasticus]